MSSAWSHGTFCRRSVTLPFTESLTTMFWPLASASSCSTARVSMSWKFSVRRSPVYSGLSSGGVRGLALRANLDHVLVVGLIGELLDSRRSALMAMRAPLPTRVTSKPVTGVPKSVVS